ncbi:MAG TPA: hypothetical protein VF748_15125 [Candidatus Acidoferrum sp.]
MTNDEQVALAAYLVANFDSATLFDFLNVHVWPSLKIKRREANMAQAQAYRDKLADEKKRKRTHVLPNKRFCDLDGSPLSDRQVMIRATHGEHVKELDTGRIMRFSEMTGYKKGTGKWVEVEQTG